MKALKISFLILIILNIGCVSPRDRSIIQWEKNERKKIEEDSLAKVLEKSKDEKLKDSTELKTN